MDADQWLRLYDVSPLTEAPSDRGHVRHPVAADGGDPAE